MSRRPDQSGSVHRFGCVPYPRIRLDPSEPRTATRSRTSRVRSTRSASCSWAAVALRWVWSGNSTSSRNTNRSQRLTAGRLPVSATLTDTGGPRRTGLHRSGHLASLPEFLCVANRQTFGETRCERVGHDDPHQEKRRRMSRLLSIPTTRPGRFDVAGTTLEAVVSRRLRSLSAGGATIGGS